MKINGIDEKYRGGDCLKQSLAFLLNLSPDTVPNFHKLPLSTWKQAFETWIKSQKKSLTITKDCHNKIHIAIYRLWCKKTNEKMSLHAVVVDHEDKIVFDINSGKTMDVDYRYLVRRYIIE